MALEDYRTYDETDEDGDITVAENTLTIATMRRDVESHVQDDKGINHFGDFEHELDVKITASALRSMCGCHFVSNGYNTLNEMRDNNSGIGVFLYRLAGGNYAIYLEDSETNNSDNDALTVNIDYWLTVERVKGTTTYTVDTYSDAARTVWVHTITVICNTTDYSIIGACFSYEEDINFPDATMSCLIRNLDLQEVVGDVGTGVMAWDGTQNVELARDDTSPVQMYNGVEIIGIKLVAPNHADATPIHVWDGVSIKAWKKKV